MRKQSKYTILLLGIGFLSIFIGLEVAKAQEVTVINNTLFSPLDISDNSFLEIFDEEGNLIDTTSIGQIYRDSNKQFPTVEIFTSDPFLVDDSGMVVEDPTRDVLDQSTMEAGVTSDGKVLYLKKFNVAVDVAVRTWTNLPELNYYTESLSPFDNYAFAHAGRADFDAFDMGLVEPWGPQTSNYDLQIGAGVYDTLDGYTHNDNEGDIEPVGVILAKLDCGIKNWDVNYYVTGAKIENSLYQMGYTPEVLRGQETAGTLDDAVNFLTNSFSNKKVIVKPTISLDAIQNMVTYDYVRETEEGELVRITTDSAITGFFDVDTIRGIERSGLIPNTIYQTINELNLNMGFDDADIEVQSGEVDLPDDKSPSTIERGYSAHFLYQNTEPTYHGGLHRVYSEANSDIDSRPISILEYPNGIIDWNLPTTASIQVEMELQPLTTISWAQYQLKYTAWLFDGQWPDKRDQVLSNVRTITYPYKITMTNVYGIQRMIFEVAALTENSAYLVNADGVPIDEKTLTDDEITSLGILPNFNDVSGTLTERTFSWENFFGGLFGDIITIIILVVVGIGVVAVIIVVIRFSGNISQGIQRRQQRRARREEQQYRQEKEYKTIS
jgi:hypothetical protein